MSTSSFDERATEACFALLGERADRVEFPAGRSRRSVRVFLPERSVIVTRRKNSARAAHEVQILQSLGAAGAPVPGVIGWHDGWLIQEDLGGVRLTEAIANGSPGEAERALELALDALSRCHAAGRAAGLANGRSQLGAAPEWRRTFVSMPARIGTVAGITPPLLDESRLIERIQPDRAWFIKWDARPGNAVLCDNGRVAWFDWEHGGVRSPLDDVAWLLGDEYVGNWPEVEETLLSHHIADFGRDIGELQARDYLATFSCLHVCVRLALIFSYRQRDGYWWDRRQTIGKDRVGVDRELALAACAKAARWAAQTTLLQSLADWFAEIAEWTRSLD